MHCTAVGDLRQVICLACQLDAFVSIRYLTQQRIRARWAHAGRQITEVEPVKAKIEAGTETISQSRPFWSLKAAIPSAAAQVGLTVPGHSLCARLGRYAGRRNRQTARPGSHAIHCSSKVSKHRDSLGMATQPSPEGDRLGEDGTYPN